ncbi:MAG: RNA polymerase sigma factor SigJ [Rhodospirillales bacterium]
MNEQSKLEAFEAARPRLMGIAYRLLGSLAEAEDAVQDVAAKWFAGNAERIEEPAAWLTRLCTNRCLDLLKSAQRSRSDYVGPWLPDQLLVDPAPDAAEQLEVASSLTTAFLLLLERLTPKERAAYLLHDIFGLSFKEVAETLGLQETGCRKLASRARKLVTQERVRFVPDAARQAELLALFRAAVGEGALAPLLAALTEDVTLRADSGGKVTAVRKVLSGRAAVGRFLGKGLYRFWSPATFETLAVNGGQGLLVRKGAEIYAVVTFGFTAQGRIADIFILRNPEKIARVLERRAAGGRDGALLLH